MTAWVIFSPSCASASALSLPRIIAEISGGLKRFVLPLDLHFDVRVAIGSLDDLVRNALDLLLNFRELAAHEALDGKNGVLRIGDRLALGGLADKSLAGLRKCHHRRRRARAFGILQNHGLAALHDGHAGVRGAQINA